MALRMTGLASGLDTESIIKELMTAKSVQKTKLEQSKTKLEWKKEKWAELNTKLYDLFRNQVSKMRLQSTYNAKATSSSNEAVASVKATSNATNGSYTMAVSQVATAQYLTSAKLDASGVSGGKVTNNTKMSELDSGLVGKEIQITSGGKQVNFQVRSDSTISDYVSALKSAGLNANFDEAQGRFFIGGKDSGASNSYSITTVNLSQGELDARAALEAALDYGNMNSSSKAAVTAVYQNLTSLSADATEDDRQAAVQKALETLTDVGYTKQVSDITTAATQVLKAQLYNENYDSIYNEQKQTYYDIDSEGNATVKESYATKYGTQFDTLTEDDKVRAGVATKEEYIQKSVDALVEKAAKAATTSKVNSLISSDLAAKERLAELKLDGVSDLSGFSEAQIEEFGLQTFDGTSVKTREALQATLTGLVNAYANVSDRSSSTDGSALGSLGMTDISVDENGAKATGVAPTGMALIAAADSKITLNGAELTASSNTISVNGLTIDVKSKTAANETITFTVSNDTSGVYNTVKSFVSEYNAIVKEMYSLFNASSSKGYEPLTDDQKKEMSESQIEDWEKKIKGSLLRRDSQLGDLMSSMRTALSSSVQIDGKSYSLSTFGITTSSLISENGMLHIYGDKDDAAFSGENDLLTKALTENPELVAKALSGVVSKLYETMNKKMASSQVSSAFTFYNDKKMNSDIDDYTKKIKDWTSRLQDQEDSYYKQYSALETAMAKLNSQMNSLSSLFGS